MTSPSEPPPHSPAVASPPPSPLLSPDPGTKNQQVIPRRKAASVSGKSDIAGLAPAGGGTSSGSASSTSVSGMVNPSLTTGTTATSSSAVPSPPDGDESTLSGSGLKATGFALAPSSLPVSAIARRTSATSSTNLAGLSAPPLTQAPGSGAGKMAAAAAAAMKRSEEDETPPEEHPLSDRCLSARGYHTLHAMQTLFHVPNRWKLLRPLGQGAYGLVISVQDSLSGEPVAVKCITRVFDKPILAKRALREITLLRHFGEHENLTGLIDLDNVWQGYNEIYLYMEPMEADLHQIVRSGQPLSNLHIQFFLYQLLRGMKYIHSANVIHRDLKPGNLLVNSDCELKICDFGLARGFRPVTGESAQNEELKMTEYVATRWYRAPEIMLSNKRYTTAMDVWSIGCILGELLGGKPMFKGKDYVDQLNLILGILGTPDDATLETMSSEKARMYLKTLPHSDPMDLSSVLPEADPQGLDLLAKMLAFDPTKRLDVVTALEHPYVGAYHDPADEPDCEVFDRWEEVESLQTIEELRAALTQEIAEYRAEVRGLAQLEAGFDPSTDYEYASEVEEGSTETETAEPEEMKEIHVDTTKTPESPSEWTGSPDVRTKLGIAAAGGRSPTLSPRRPRQQSHSPMAARTPRTPATSGSEASFGHSAASSRRPSRRSSSHNPRRSMSFLFGGGMTMSSLAMTSTNGPQATAVATASSAESANSTWTAGSMSGRRSRAPSGASASVTDMASLRPLLRQLSTANLAELKQAMATDDEPLITHSPSGEGPIVMSRRGSRGRRSTGSTGL